MDKVYRTGVAIDVALRAAAMRNTSNAHQIQPPSALSMQAARTEPIASVPVPVAASGLRAGIKRALRVTVKMAWRLVRPAIRPVVFRTRRYFSLEIQQEIQRSNDATAQAIERMSADLMREIQVSRELLRNELAGGQQHAGEHLVQRIDQVERHMLDRIVGVERHMLDRIVDVEHHMLDRSVDVERQTLDRIAQLAIDLPARLDERDAKLEVLQKATTGIGRQLTALTLNLPPRLDRIEQYGYASARRVIIACGPDEVLLKTESGYVVCPVSDLSILACLADTGDLERGTRLLIQRSLRPGDVFVDVGANLGIHTLAAASALQGQGKIIAFEPFDKTCQLLEQTVRINGHTPITTIYQAAVSDSSGRQSLYLGKSSGHHSLYALASDDATGTATATVEVNTMRLDDAIQPGQAVNLIKIDAEGAELAVLDSAAGTIAANPDIALIVEFGPSHLVRNGQDGRDWLAHFAAMGLTYRVIDPDRGTLDTWDLERLLAIDSVNLLFARPEAPIWARLGVV